MTATSTPLKGKPPAKRPSPKVERETTWEVLGNPLAELAACNRFHIRIVTVWSDDSVCDWCYTVIPFPTLIRSRVTWMVKREDVTPSSKQEAYDLDFSRPSCDCADYRYRRAKLGEPCKHLLALAEALEHLGLDPVTGQPCPKEEPCSASKESPSQSPCPCSGTGSPTACRSN